MEKLGKRDLRRVLEAVSILGTDIDYASFPRRAVDAIATAVDVDLVSYNEIDPASGKHRFLLQPDPSDLMPGTLEHSRFVQRFGGHPLVAHSVTVAGRADGRLRPFVDRLRLMGMVGNCCAEGELRLNLGMTVADAQSCRIGIAVYRSLKDFDDLDGARIEALRPHVQTALKAAMQTAKIPLPAPAVENANLTIERPLTPRESEVLYWVSMGKTNEQIGEIVGAKPLTIKKHLEHIYDKLGVPNRTAAARFAAAQHEPA